MIEVTIYTPQDLNHSSYIQAGLFELEKSGLIVCKYKIDITKKLGRISTETGNEIVSNHPQQKTSYYKLYDAKLEKEIFFATDLYDVSYFFSKYALEKCDYVFKRNYVSDYIKYLRPEYQSKIYPMGLTLGVQSSNRKYWNIFKVAHFIANLNLQVKFDKLVFKRIFNVIEKTSRHRKYVTKGRSLSALEEVPLKTNLKVFYQVRCFPQVESLIVKKINDERSTLVKLLKEGLNNDFVGGIVPCKISNKFYPDCLTNLPTDPVSYLNLIKNSAICIYTKGLQDSPARKLAEYLSQGKCIVAERFDTELPEELEHEKNIMFFDSFESCIEICKELLNNPEKVNYISKNARIYFENHVHPKQNIKRILTFMLQQKNTCKNS